MFRATYRSSSVAPNCICSLWFIYCPCGDRPLSRLGGNSLELLMMNGMPLETCWVFSCFGIINSITRLHLIGYFYWFIPRCTDPWISSRMRFYVMYVLPDIVTVIFPATNEAGMYFKNIKLAFKQLCAQGYRFRNLVVFVLWFAPNLQIYSTI
jgi:hypothetical protein